jgi:hypothetical protein
MSGSMVLSRVFFLVFAAVHCTAAARPDAPGQASAIVVNTWPFVNATAKAWEYLTNGYTSVEAVVEVRLTRRLVISDQLISATIFRITVTQTCILRTCMRPVRLPLTKACVKPRMACITAKISRNSAVMRIP